MEKQTTVEKGICHTGITDNWLLPDYKKSHTNGWEKDKKLSRI